MLLVLALRALTIHAATGDLDPTFGSGGVLVTSFGPSAAVGRVQVLLQPDGKIVAAGGVRADPVTDTGDFDVAIARYLADGTPDATFGVGGIVITDLGGTVGWRAGDAVLQADGGIVVSGTRTDGFDFRTALRRYLADGSIDVLFGTGGMVEIPPLEGRGDLALQPDGKIVVAATAVDLVLGFQFGSARLSADGTLDATYGSGGVVATDTSAGTFVTAVVLQADGKIIVAGAESGEGVMFRYDTSGILDPSFGAGGKTVDAGISAIRELLVRPDGTVMAWTERFPLEQLAMRRYDAAGGLDVAFGDGGERATPVGYRSGFGSAVTQDADGNVLLVSFVTNTPGMPGARAPAVVRYRPSMLLDPTFGGGGFATGASGDLFDSVVAEPDGDVIVGGLTDAGPPALLLARYDGDCPSSPDADGDGIGDFCDPCTAPAPIDNALLRVTKIAPPQGDDTFKIGGMVALPPIDPIADGLRMLVTDAIGEPFLDVWLPSGVFDPVEKVGWSTNASQTAYVYRNRSETLLPIRSIVSVRIKALDTPGLGKISIKGRKGGYPVAPAQLPLTMAVMFDPPRSTGSDCVSAAFPGPPPLPSCAFNGPATAVKCR